MATLDISIFDMLGLPSPSPLGEGERVPTIQEIALTRQLAELPMEVKGWAWPDGRPMKVKVRALTFAERRECNRLAMEAGLKAMPKGFTPGQVLPFDDDVWALEAVVRGLVEPKLPRAAIAVLGDMNAAIIDQLADAITRLGKLPAAFVAAELERLAGRAVPPAPDAPAAADAGE